MSHQTRDPDWRAARTGNLPLVGVIRKRGSIGRCEISEALARETGARRWEKGATKLVKIEYAARILNSDAERAARQIANSPAGSRPPFRLRSERRTNMWRRAQGRLLEWIPRVVLVIGGVKGRGGGTD